MKALLPSILTACLLFTGCHYDVFASSDRYRENFEKSATLGDGGELTIQSFNGSIEVSGWEKDEVLLTGEKYAATKELLDNIEVKLEQQDHAIRVVAEKPARMRGSAGVRMVVRAPHGAELRLVRTSNGRVTVEHFTAGAEVETSNGRVEVRRLQGPVTVRTSNGRVEADEIEGSLRIQTSNGSIRVHRIQGALDAKSSNGSVEADLSALAERAPVGIQTSNSSISLTVDQVRDNPVTLKTSNGRVKVKLPESAKVSFDVSTSNGKIKTELPLTPERQNKHHLRGSLNGGGALWEVRTSNGSVEIERGL